MWRFIQSATNEANWPKSHIKEVCFIGRSNVGKSSLINALAKQKIARTSSTPGRTTTLNFFEDDKRVYVDLPGYGFAKVPVKVHNRILSMVENYLEKRTQLVKVFVLVDAKVGLTKDDFLMLDYLKLANKKYLIVITRSDKSNQVELNKTIQQAKIYTQDFICVSSFKRKNLNKLDKLIKNSFLRR